MVEGRAERARTITTLGAASIRVGAQALFFLLLPKLVEPTTASALFLAASISAVAAPTSALGSQFRMIRQLSWGEQPRPRSVTSWYHGLVVLLVISGATEIIYTSALPVSFPAMSTYLAANYLRVFADSYAQGSGRYNISQTAYIAFWAFKLLFVIGAFNLGWELSFAQYALLELGASAPWALVTVGLLFRWRVTPTWRIPIREDGLTVLAVLSRNAWLEADRIVLPLLIAPDLYLQYSLVSRVLTAGMTLLLAHLAVITPSIVRSRPSELRNLAHQGRPIVLISLLAYALGGAAIATVYQDISPVIWVVYAVSTLALPLAYSSAIHIDFVFYNVGPHKRLAINILALSVVVVGLALVSLTGWLPAASTAIVLSYVIAQQLGSTFAAGTSRD